MTDMELLRAIQKIIDPNTVNNIKKFVIIQENNGYRVFEKYLITKTNVGFKVIKLYNDVEHVFLTLKNALIWCTLDNKNLVVESQRVKFLDSQLTGLSMSTVLIERYLKNIKDKDKKFIYSNKLIENKIKQDRLTTEMTDFCQKAKRFQMNWLNNSSYK